MILLYSIVLYKKSFDYCRNCKMEAERIKEEFKKEYDCEYAILNNKLKSKKNQHFCAIIPTKKAKIFNFFTELLAKAKVVC